MRPEQPARDVAFVTGAAGGIGKALVTRLRERGTRVYATDLGLAAIPCGDPGFVAASLDVVDEAQIARHIAECLVAFGRLDHVVHLAGQVGAGPLGRVTVEEWRRLLDVNLTSGFVLAREAHAALRAARGTLTFTASTHALNGGTALSGPAYAVAKAGLVNLTRYLAKEWAAEGIRVNAVAPGPIDTPMLARLEPAAREQLAMAVPLRRLGEAADVAGAILYLTGPDAKYVTGTVQNISGGLVLD